MAFAALCLCGPSCTKTFYHNVCFEPNSLIISVVKWVSIECLGPRLKVNDGLAKYRPRLSYSKLFSLKLY